MEFKKTYIAGLLLDDSLRKTILSIKHGKLNAFTTLRNPKEVSDQVWLSKYIFDETNYQVEPDLWRLVVTVRRIDQESEIYVYSAATQLKFIEDPKYRIVNIGKLDNTVPPIYRWIIPMSCDPSVLNSQYNQIIIR